MTTLIAIIESVPSDAHREMAIGALRAECARRDIVVLLQQPTGAPDAPDDGVAATLIVTTEVAVADAFEPSDDTSVRRASPAEVIRHTRALLAELFGPEAASPGSSAKRRSVVAVTACPTGIAHTFMAAEALRTAGAKLGVAIQVETRGSVGAKNLLTDEQIADADAVIIAADTGVDTARFAGKRLYETGTKAALRDGGGVIEAALALSAPAPLTRAAAIPSANASASPATRTSGTGADSKGRTGVYKHLMSGVSHMLPLVVAGGLMIALAFTVGGIHAGDAEGTLGHALMMIGAKSAFALMVPVLAGFIAFSIADRPGLGPGLVGGMLASLTGAGFLGGLAAGFVAGYATRWLNRSIELPDALSGLKPVLILPLLGTLIVGLAMVFLIGPPAAAAMDALTEFLRSMQSGSAVVLGLLLGAMMAFDMGGPVNKAAYTFAVGLLASEVYGPMAAVMAAGMTPPLGLAVASALFPNRFGEAERAASKPAALLGLAFITEGAIPYAAADPLRVIPCLILGSATAGALSLALSVQLMVPHGGGFVLLIPNALTPIVSFLLALVAGTIVTALSLRVAKDPAPAPDGRDASTSAAPSVG